MGFPENGILDNFNRANENPLANGTWSGPVFSIHGNLQLISNQVGNSAAGAFSRYWSSALFGPQCEVYITIPIVGAGGAEVNLFLRTANENSSTLLGYQFNMPIGGSWGIYRIDNASSVLLGATFTQTLSAGDTLGFSAKASTLTARYKASGGNWTILATRTDLTYLQAGHIGLEIDDATTKGDDFGGGTLAQFRPNIPHPISSQFYHEDDGRFADLDVRNWFRRSLVPA